MFNNLHGRAFDYEAKAGPVTRSNLGGDISNILVIALNSQYAPLPVKMHLVVLRMILTSPQKEEFRMYSSSIFTRSS